MRITLLGTGSPIPDPDRAGPATLLQTESTNLLFDCGRGVVMRLAKAGLFPSMLSAVVLTHLHSDHVSDLNDVITTHWIMSPPGSRLRVVGPIGTEPHVRELMVSMQRDVNYRRSHHEDLVSGPALDVTEVTPRQSLTLGDTAILVGATDHRPVEPTVAYRVTSGETSVVVAGDGVPCATLDELLRGATAYVQTVIREDLVRQIPSTRLQDILDYHATVSQAAASAQRAGVRVLVLTHYVPAPQPGREEEWRALAAGFNGEVVIGDDLTTVEL